MSREVQLRRLTQELEKEPAPELDWDRMEQKLLASVGSASARHPRVRRAPVIWAAAGALALAAGAALVWRTPRPAPVSTQAPAVTTRVHPATTAPTTALDGDGLAVGAVVAANDQPVVVSHAARASWTLEPHSRAHLVLRGELLTVALDTGAVDVSVVPHRAGEEVFAVEARLTRVAAHGTRFRVALVGEQLQVDVSEGVVGVGASSDRGHTHGFNLPAPSRGAFGLDGKTGTVWSSSGAASVADLHLARKAPPHASPHVDRVASALDSAAPAPSAPGTEPVAAPPSTAPRELERVPTIGEIDDGLEAFQLASDRCFETQAGPASGVRVTVHVTAVIDIAPSGLINGVEFVPPLAPGVQSCVDGRVPSVKFAPSRDGIKVERTVEFTK